MFPKQFWGRGFFPEQFWPGAGEAVPIDLICFDFIVYRDGASLVVEVDSVCLLALDSPAAVVNVGPFDTGTIALEQDKADVNLTEC